MFVSVGITQQRLIQGRWSGQHIDALCLDATEYRARIEHGLWHHSGTGHQTREYPSLVAEGMEERVHDQVAVAWPEANDRSPCAECPQRLRVRCHRAFRMARRAG